MSCSYWRTGMIAKSSLRSRVAIPLKITCAFADLYAGLIGLEKKTVNSAFKGMLLNCSSKTTD